MTSAKDHGLCVVKNELGEMQVKLEKNAAIKEFEKNPIIVDHVKVDINKSLEGAYKKANDTNENEESRESENDCSDKDKHDKTNITFILSSTNLPDYNIESVKLRGSWDCWDSSATLLRDGLDWKANIISEFQAGTYEFKYIINESDWIVDASRPTITRDGITNNFLTVE